MKTLIKILWVCWLLGVLTIVSLFILVWMGVAGPLPSFKELENPQYKLASRIFSADGVEIGKFYIHERVFVPYDSISPWVIKALIATEDTRFFKHAGIDWKGTIAAVIYTLAGKRRGGSTITQQLAKNLFPRTRTDNLLWLILMKAREWIVAVELERMYTKKEILTMYLNIAPFGGVIYGIHSASNYYFNKPPSQLNPEESALLIGMLKGTYYYNPFYFPERAKHRRNVVLYRMWKAGYITREEFDSLKTLPLKVRQIKDQQQEQPARYFVEYVKQKTLEILKHVRKADGSPYNIYTDGLKIYTTLNSRIQHYAEEAVRQHLGFLQQVFWKQFSSNIWEKYRDVLISEARKTARYQYYRDSLGLDHRTALDKLKEPVKMKIFSWNGTKDTVMSPWDSIKHHLSIMQVGLLAVDASTGAILAWVGGPDYRFFQYDHVLAKRQVGSAIKPFIYSLPISRGWSPCMKLANEPVIFEDFDNWSPENAGGIIGGMVTLAQGLAYSLNIITARIVKYFSPSIVAEFVEKFGIADSIPPYPSIVLGTTQIPLYQMVAGFTTFHQRGVRVEPYAIEMITDRHGRILYQHTPAMKLVLSPRDAQTMLLMLKQVVDHGTAIRLRYKYKLQGDLAGKTGTTQEHADGWFIGIAPGIIIGVWVGWEYPFLHFKTMEWGQGASMALPIFALTIQKVWQDPSLPYKPGKFYTLPPGYEQQFECIVNWRSLKETIESTKEGSSHPIF